MNEVEVVEHPKSWVIIAFLKALGIKAEIVKHPSPNRVTIVYAPHNPGERFFWIPETPDDFISMMEKKIRCGADDDYLNCELNRFWEMFSKWLTEKSIKIRRRPLYPDNKKFALILTHDVDILKYWWLGTIGRSVELCKLRQYRKVANSWKHCMKDVITWRNPFNTFKKYMDIEEKYGARSTFFFIVNADGIRSFWQNRGGDYKIEGIKTILQYIKDRGWEVGLHASYLSHIKKDTLCREKTILEEVLGDNVIGVRHHFLRLEIPLTWKLHAECGLRYDSTYGCGSKLGWKCGFSFPFEPYSLKVLEIPLIIMDRTFSKYLGCEPSWNLIAPILDKLHNAGGTGAILWHNNAVEGGGNIGYLELYEKILDWCHNNGGWLTSGEYFLRHWESLWQ